MDLCRYVSACSSLACADPSLPDETHDHYYEELLRIAGERKKQGNQVVLKFPSPVLQDLGFY